MSRRKLSRLTSQQDIESACEWMDRRERDAIEARDQEIADRRADERALAEALSSAFDDA